MKIDNLLFIFNNFGIAKQLDKLHEECGELSEAITISMQAYQGDADKAIQTPAIISEMADVAVMLAQFKFAEPHIWEQVEAEVEAKIDRTLDRIKSGYYE